MNLSWDVTFSVRPTRREAKAARRAGGEARPKEVLKACAGHADGGRLCAILGPSGSGKTSLLGALAGRLPRTKGGVLRGWVRADGLEAGEPVGFVPQDDIFFSQLTVQETLEMKAALLLPAEVTPAQRAGVVAKLLRRLGLVKCAGTPVGGRKTRGISGGERKRLSIACELLREPQVLFADEPTTGLDAFQAGRVVGMLKALAEDGHTVVCSVHQPRGSIFEMFDDIVLLSEGAVAYAGPAKEALDYFAALGHRCPKRANPAEFLIDLVSIDYSSPEAEAETRRKVEGLAGAFAMFRRKRVSFDAGLKRRRRTSSSEAPVQLGGVAAAAEARTCAPLGTQVLWLLRRAWKQIARDKPTNRLRLSTNVNSAFVFGSIFWRMALGQSRIQDRMGLLQVCAINTAMASLTKTCQIFPTEKALVQQERASGAYTAGPYLASKLLAELPIAACFPLAFGALVYPLTGLNPAAGRFARFLGVTTLESFASSALGMTVGSLAPTPEAATALGPAVMVIFIVFGGYYVNPDNVPAALRWLPRASLIRWAFQALCINEFRGLRFDAPQPGDVATGERVLENLSFRGGLGDAVQAKGRILLVNYWLTYQLLKGSAARFEPMEEYSRSRTASAEDAAEGEGEGTLKKRSSLKKMSSIQRVVRRASDLVTRVRTASAASSEASEDRGGEPEAPEPPAAAA